MFVLICGCGRVGSTVARAMLNEGHQVSVLDEDAEALAMLEKNQDESWEDLGGSFTVGTALEIDALLEAGIEQADAFVAATDGDNTNLVIAQIAKRRFNVPTVVVRVIARCNNPRNLQHFELLGIKPAVSATDLILRLIEHEVPRYGFLHLLDLPQERLEIIEIEVAEGSPAAGKRVRDLGIPDGSLVISILRNGTGFVPLADSVVEAGDEVLLVLDSGLEDE